MSTPRQKNDRIGDKKTQRKLRQHCRDYIVATIKAANRAINYSDFGKAFHYGTLRNEMSILVELKIVLTLPKECPGRFILSKWATRPEYAWVLRNDKECRVGKFDFLSYLERLTWEKKLCVHNLKFTFQAYQYGWINPSGWKYLKSNHSYQRLFTLSYPVKVQCFDTGTVMISIACSNRPFPLDAAGIGELQSLLGEVKHALHAPCVPDTGDWFVVQWHLNRDSEELLGGGVDVYLTFRDFFEDSAKFYYKHTIDKMRAEVSQSPRQPVKQIFENILNRDSFGDDKTC